jgi:hypothetical protein
MSNPMIAPFVAAAVAIAGLAAAQTPPPQAVPAPMSKNVKEAKAALVRGKADAKFDRVAVDARQLAVEKQTEALMESNDDKRDAEYALAVEKCGLQAGPPKDACVGNAKLRYGKS